MSVRKQNEKKVFNIYLIPALILCVVFIYSLFSFGFDMTNTAKNQVKEDFLEEVNEICILYEKELYAVQKETGLIADYLFETEEISCEENVDLVNKAVKSMGADNAYIILPDYSAIDIDGNRYINIKEEESVYDEIITNSLKSLVFAKNKNGKYLSYIICPISSSTTLRGYLAVEYLPNVMDTLLDNPKYSSRRIYTLISSEGILIDRTGSLKGITEVGDNILDASQQLQFIEGSYGDLKRAVRDLKSGCIKVELNGDTRCIYYKPVKGCKAMVSMTVYADEVDKTYSTVSKDIRSMLLEIGITIIVFLLVIVGISIFNKAKYNVESEDLQNKADTDLLTDLYNKMATERMIKEYLEGEGKDSISMMFVLDVDNFKKINDTMGHAFGDQVLSQLGHQIRAWFRVNDIVGRIGGDEFMVFIKDVKDPEIIKREGSRIMQFFEGFNVGEYTRYSPTASIGGAVFPNDGNDFESLYKAADKAVYKSKKEGKNRVSFYGDLNIIEKNAVEDKDDK